MAKSESTRGKGAKDGEAGRAASGASSNGDGEGAGAAPSKAASKSAGGASPAKKSAAGGGGAAARKRPGGAGAGAGTGAGAGDGSPALEGGATAKKRSGGGAAGKSARGGGGQGDELSGHLREFARARPHGWGHDDWLRLLSELRGRGHDVSNEAGVGLQLERERLRHQLESVEGLTERQTASLVDRFGTFYSLRQASVDEIASVKGVNRHTAERIRERFG